MTTRRELDLKLIAAVERLGRALRSARQDVATELSLSLLQLQLVEHLAHLGERRVGSLARELDVTQPTISDALTSLEAKAIIERTADPSDRRATLAALTPAGVRVGSEAARVLDPLFGDDRETTDDDQATALRVMLSEIGRLQRAGVITVNRSCLSCLHYQQPATGEAARCLLLKTPLAAADLRVDCPEHEQIVINH